MLLNADKNKNFKFIMRMKLKKYSFKILKYIESLIAKLGKLYNGVLFNGKTINGRL